MRLYFIRHAKRGFGVDQDTLTDEGIKQTIKLADYIKKIKFDKIICGNLNRSRSTIYPIINALNVPIEFIIEVNEQDIGIFKGKTAEEWRNAVKLSGCDKDSFKPKDGESVIESYHRAEKFVERLKKLKNHQKILIISHSGFISDIATILLKKRREENKDFKTDFCALTYFNLDNNFNVTNYVINKRII